VRDHDDNILEMSGGPQANEAMELVFQTFRFVAAK
jgi:hypothetical protein